MAARVAGARRPAGKDQAVSRGRCFAGTSGWSYPHWAKGRFYPRGLKAGEWLAFYAQRFATVEVNSTFYRLPKIEFIQRWGEVTPDEFRFAVKLWRRITHEKRLVDCAAEIEQFLAGVEPLRGKLGPILVQLPPSLRPGLETLDAFLTDYRKIAGKTARPVAVEVRNTDWLIPAAYALLDRHGAALCLADSERLEIAEPNAAPFVYIRRHGPGGRYRGCYSPAALAADAAHIRQLLNESRDVYIYFNNDIGGHAVDNARDLIQAVQRPSVSGNSLR